MKTKQKNGYTATEDLSLGIKQESKDIFSITKKSSWSDEHTSIIISRKELEALFKAHDGNEALFKAHLKGRENE